MKKLILLLLPALAFAACNSGEQITTRRVMEPVVRVVEYTPAPGQFINEDNVMSGFDGENTPDKARSYAERRLAKSDFVSLGGWGGYIVAAFKESVPVDEDYEIYVGGNALPVSSEPGIVWVTDKTGFASGVWYELAGSEWDDANTVRNYQITYYPAAGLADPIRWEDNMGADGTIDRMAQHTQTSYFPAWLGSGPVTFTGTRLPGNIGQGTVDGENAYIPHPYAWGYADNYSTVDGAGTVSNPNKFRISSARTADGMPANLEKVDYIKIQTGINAKAPAIGEVSTEVCSIGCFRIVKESN